MLKDVAIPDISENVTSGKIVAVLVKAGDTVTVDQVLVEFETDKAVVEIPCPYAGRIAEVLVADGDEKNVGDVIFRIDAETEEGAEDGTTTPPVDQDAVDREEEQKQKTGQPPEQMMAAARQAPPQEAAAAGIPEPEGKAPTPDTETVQVALPAPAAPSVRRFARELGVNIHTVKGSGPGGRISQADVTAHVKAHLGGETFTGRPVRIAAAPQPALPDFSRWGQVHSENLETVRRLTAENTSLGWRIVPQVTQFDEADISDLQDFVQTQGRRVAKQGGKLTITAIAMKVCAMALRLFPRFNASIDLEKRQMIYKDYIHIGLAVDTPRGLLVPVIRDADRKGIIKLATEIADIAERARSKKIPPDAFEGGTFTLSNQGGIGGTHFTPLVVWPQAAILGVGRARRVVMERDGQYQSRHILPLSLSYDHRIVDGADAARFLDWICRGLEQPMTLFLESFETTE